MTVHRHFWERVEWLGPLDAFTCRCGAAYSNVEGRVHYSPRRLVNNRYVWKLVNAGGRPPEAAPAPASADS